MNIVSKFTIEKNIQYRTDEGFRNNINFILTFLSVVIFGLFAIRPSITTISGLIRDLDQYRKVNGVLTEKIAILNDVKSDEGKLTHETELIAQALPDSPDEGNYIRNVNFIASKNNIQIESIYFTTNTEEALGSLNFSLIIHGQYPQLVDFMSDFNKLLRVTTVSDIDLTLQNENFEAVKATITGKSYFIKSNDVQH